MENSRVKEESIQKYFDALVELRNVLKYTSRISLDDFCSKNNISKNLSKVLQKGGVIKCITKGKYSQWEWTTIEPTKQMAVKSIQMLGTLNPPRKPKTIINNKINSNIIKIDENVVKTKIEEQTSISNNRTIVIRLFFGLFTFTINI